MSEQKVMPLSQAIRLGATLKPQAFGFFYKDGGSCAMGAAYDAIGLLTNALNDIYLYPIRMEKEWDMIINYIYTKRCPVCLFSIYNSASSANIAHLNDVHKWTRERIADFVEQCEKELASAETIQEEAKEQKIQEISHIEI